MLMNSKVVSNEDILCDAEMLIEYLTKYLNGKISSEKYGNPFGEGRINVYASQEEVLIDDNNDNTVVDDNVNDVKTEEVSNMNASNNKENDKDKIESNSSLSKKGKNPGTGDNDNINLWIALAVISLGGIAIVKVNKKRSA